MDYIVNHWLIYLVGTLNVIDVVLFITIVLGFMFFYFSVENKDVIDKKCIKYVVAAMLVSTILSILFPSSDTGYKMLGNSIDTGSVK